MSVTIDPRRHDAVLLRLDGGADTAALTERLREAGVRVAAVGSDSSGAELVTAAAGLAVRPGR